MKLEAFMTSCRHGVVVVVVVVVVVGGELNCVVTWII